MKAFKPSPYFAFRVMAEIRAYEAARTKERLWTQRFFSLKAVRCALGFGGALVGLMNLIRMYLAVFSPVLSR